MGLTMLCEARPVDAPFFFSAKKLGLKIALALYGQTEKAASASIDYKLKIIDDLLEIVE